MRAIGYVRVSTEKQADFGVSLEAQSEKVRAMAVVQGAELVEVIIDACESAKSLNRPGMARLLSLVDAGAVDIVIIAKLDRLSRSLKDLAELLERFTRRGVSLVSMDIPPLKEFADKDFLTFIKARFHNKPNTLEYYKYYKNGLRSLKAHAPLAGCTLDTITAFLGSARSWRSCVRTACPSQASTAN
jgi:hypothetical protein